jgi:adenylate cyclase
MDEEINQLWTIVTKDQGSGLLEVRIPAEPGSITGEVATFKKTINIPYDFFDDPRSKDAKELYQKTGYRTYTMLTLPVLNEQGDLIAIVQLLNKLKFPHKPLDPLDEKIDLTGFTTDDENLFEELAPSICLILESSKLLRGAIQKQRLSQALTSAINSIMQNSLDLEKTHQKVINEVRQLVNADRGTLWLVDCDHQDLKTIISVGGSLRELRIPLTAQSFAGQVALTGEPVNIRFDLYNSPVSETSKQSDRTSGYRTCSLLCMPVFNTEGDLIGVTQLINKIKQGEFPPYNPADWPAAPECWKASFDHSDEEFVEAFNVQAGIALQNAMTFATVKQNEQRQLDLLRNISQGIISTDKDGRIIAINERVKELLGLSPQENLEGKLLFDVFQIKEKEGNFSQWFEAALNATDETNRQQFYPEQTLIRADGDSRSVNLSLNTKVNPNNANQANGVLVLIDEISDIQRLKSVGYRYMSQDLVEQLLKSDDPKLEGDRREISVLFSDIRSFTLWLESTSPEEVVSSLNEYFELMGEAVIKYKGTLDKYMADAMMVTFGAALPLADHAWMALLTATEMRHQLKEFNARRIAAHKPVISIGIGINSDMAVTGYVGSSRFGQFTALGQGVNLAARLEGVTKRYGCDIAISENTLRPCRDRVWVRELDKIMVSGKYPPVLIYELVGLKSEPISQQKQDAIAHYAKGREYYLARQFYKALNEFATIVEEIDTNDKAAKLQMERSLHYVNTPPPEDWDGVWAPIKT